VTECVEGRGDGPGADLPEVRVEYGEHLFDVVQIGRTRRQSKASTTMFRKCGRGVAVRSTCSDSSSTTVTMSIFKNRHRVAYR